MAAHQSALPLSENTADTVLRELRVNPVLLLRPPQQMSPLIFASPHSGPIYPDAFVQQTKLDPLTLRKSEDAYVDELFAPVVELGATWPSRGSISSGRRGALPFDSLLLRVAKKGETKC